MPTCSLCPRPPPSPREDTFSVKGTLLDVTGVGWQRQVGWHLLTPAINLMETWCEHMHPGILPPAGLKILGVGNGRTPLVPGMGGPTLTL